MDNNKKHKAKLNTWIGDRFREVLFLFETVEEAIRFAHEYKQAHDEKHHLKIYDCDDQVVYAHIHHHEGDDHRRHKHYHDDDDDSYA